MKHEHDTDVQAQRVEAPGAKDATVRWLIAERDGAPNFYMRRFDLGPGGQTPSHAHAWEHEVYILEGSGTVFCNGAPEPVQPGDFVFVAPNEKHNFAAAPDEKLAFLCLIPKEGQPH